MRERHVIDTHKGITGLVILGLIAWQDAWRNPAALTYLAMHGGYGLMWVVKSRLFPDKSWEKPCSLPRAAVIWVALSLYWIAPWLLITSGARPEAWLTALSVTLFASGVFLHFCSDMQKFTALQLQPGHLINSGLFSRLRNPNYLGELLIYLVFRDARDALASVRRARAFRFVLLAAQHAAQGSLAVALSGVCRLA